MDAARFHGIYPILCRSSIATAARASRSRRSRRRCGTAHGVAVLGLATETNARRARAPGGHVVTAEAVAGRLPLAVTVAEPSVPGQVALFGQQRGRRLGHSAAAGRRVPRNRVHPLLRCGRQRVDVPVALQNAAQFLGVGLSNAGLRPLLEPPNVCLLKGEAPARDPAPDRNSRARSASSTVAAGSGARQPPRQLRRDDPSAGVLRRQVALYEGMRRGDEAEAERLYREICAHHLHDVVDRRSSATASGSPRGGSASPGSTTRRTSSRAPSGWRCSSGSRRPDRCSRLLRLHPPGVPSGHHGNRILRVLPRCRLAPCLYAQTQGAATAVPAAGNRNRLGVLGRPEGQLTASGQRYDGSRLTAAHRTPSARASA
jgi:hypothetical protein